MLYMQKNWQKDYPINEGVTDVSLDINGSLKKMLDLIDGGKDVIDFGCATGYFSNLLRNKGCTVTGVEVNIDAAKYCRKVIVADLDFTSVTDLVVGEKFDVAVFGDVLEHLRNPWKVLEETRSILKDDGYVVASIPNIAHGSVRLALLQGRFEYTECGILDNTHIRFFTRDTVEQLFKKSGYLASIVDRTKLDFLSDSHAIPKNNRYEFSDDIIKKIEEDADCDTLQFIIRSYPHAQYQIHCLQSELERSQLQFQHTQSELADLHSQLQQTSAQFEYTRSELANLQAQFEYTQSELINLQSQLQQTELELRRSQNLIVSMETSKFWQMRKAWFAFKQMLGIEKSNTNL
jgi:O-antigen biosynthesis protein